MIVHRALPADRCAAFEDADVRILEQHVVGIRVGRARVVGLAHRRSRRRALLLRRLDLDADDAQLAGQQFPGMLRAFDPAGLARIEVEQARLAVRQGHAEPRRVEADEHERRMRMHRALCPLRRARIEDADVLVFQNYPVNVGIDGDRVVWRGPLAGCLERNRTGNEACNAQPAMHESLPQRRAARHPHMLGLALAIVNSQAAGAVSCDGYSRVS